MRGTDVLGQHGLVCHTDSLTPQPVLQHAGVPQLSLEGVRPAPGHLMDRVWMDPRDGKVGTTTDQELMDLLDEAAA